MLAMHYACMCVFVCRVSDACASEFKCIQYMCGNKFEGIECLCACVYSRAHMHTHMLRNSPAHCKGCTSHDGSKLRVQYRRKCFIPWGVNVK